MPETIDRLLEKGLVEERKANTGATSLCFRSGLSRRRHPEIPFQNGRKERMP